MEKVLQKKEEAGARRKGNKEEGREGGKRVGRGEKM